MNPTFQKYAANNSYSEIFIFSILTLLSILNGQSTVFYVIYFFWFNELICICVDIFFKRYIRKEKEYGVFSLGSLFLMGIYATFIIVFFGFIAGWENEEMIFLNMEVLFFQNWFFNINLIFVLVKRIYLNKTTKTNKIAFGGFTANMIILHISIILGGVLMFFVVKPYPNFFSPDNLLGSVIIILPFFMLKIIAQYFIGNTQES